jgi:Rieske Fe-S protein
MTHELTRRHALTGLATVGVGAPLLAACGGDDADTAADPSTDAETPTEESAPEGSESAAGGAALAATADIEVGGGTIFPDEKVVVTQPEEGDFRAFSATCTHQGCLVSSISDGTINCACHGSQFSIADGSVQGGPAGGPLPGVDITVEGDQITLG